MRSPRKSDNNIGITIIALISIPVVIVLRGFVLSQM